VLAEHLFTEFSKLASETPRSAIVVPVSTPEKPMRPSL
jgi:hypothetical protein